MDVQRIDVGTMTVAIPGEALKLNNLPDDPPGLVAYGTETDRSAVMMTFQPIAPEDVWMPFDDIRPTIDNIHQSLGDDQGLIEVRNGSTESGRRVVESIVKTVMEMKSALYVLTMLIEYPRQVLFAQASCGELGVTGERDAMMYELARRQGMTEMEGPRGWACDPYDENFHRGILMNWGEDERFDSMFPWHALSVARTIRDLLIANN